MNKPDIFFLSHGGGPMPLLGDSSHKEMVACLKNVATKIRKPSAILIISAHWEENVATITSTLKPSLIYDYYGFPKAAYEITYPVKGEPALAQQVHKQLNKAGIKAKLDGNRGLDHGVFVPLKIMYPNADIPCVQLSLDRSLNAELHIQIGQALQALDYDNLLVIGSGFSFHNMKAFFAPESAEVLNLNKVFEQWLQNTCSNKNITEAARTELLNNWDKAPGARFCQPREEHLLPLHVCYGLANKACDESFNVTILNKLSSMYLWQG